MSLPRANRLLFLPSLKYQGIRKQLNQSSHESVPAVPAASGMGREERKDEKVEEKGQKLGPSIVASLSPRRLLMSWSPNHGCTFRLFCTGKVSQPR